MALELTNDQIVEILLNESYVEQADVDTALPIAEREEISVVDVLLSDKTITKDLLGQAIAEHYGVLYADLNSNLPSADLVNLIPKDIEEQYRVIVFKQDGNSIIVTTDNPANAELTKVLADVLPGTKARLAFSLSEDIDNVFVHYRSSLKTRFSEIIETDDRIAPELLDEIFSDALIFKASDIHFEPQMHDVIIRFRVDGLMREAGRIPKQYYENLLNRIKVLAHLRIDEHFSAQDGAIRYEKDEKITDMRVSIVPTIEGEKIVLRLLAHYVRGFSLGDIGLNAEHEDRLTKAFSKPFGMILVTGPTGSGKTTTLYSVLKMVNKPDVNITTIEDPVEYRLPGINQIQVNTETNLTFAQGLRSVVRQDPDVILVGEIRDTETAEISVNAALTGHLLLSTFHANDAATAVPRLLEMDAEPFLLASTLETIIGQRLVRKICTQCKISKQMKPAEVKQQVENGSKFFGNKTITVYYGKGCEVCSNSGYDGRTAIFEFISMTPELSELILRRPSAKEIWDLARTQGSKTLFEDGVEKVLAGVTTMEELLRVSEPPADVNAGK